MAERSATHIWLLRSVFAGLCLMLIYLQILPLETVPRRWAGPDLLVVVVILWTLRRPQSAPLPIIAGVMLLADFLLLRPPGLFAALTVVTCEGLRRRAHALRDMPFALEWVTAAIAILALGIGNRVVLSIFLVDQASLGLTLIQLIMSMLSYPIVVLVAWAFLGLRKSSPHDLDRLGANT